MVRKNPGSIGGIQRNSSRLFEGFSEHFDTERIVWKGPEWGVPAYFPVFYHKAVAGQARLVHCDDAVTSIIGAKIRKSSVKIVTATVHGLDVILPLPWYQKKVTDSLKTVDKVICVSAATSQQVKDRGIPGERIEIIHPSAEIVEGRRPKDSILLEKVRRLTGVDLAGKKILFSLGRPLRRKGFDRFIIDVFPGLPDDYVYIAAGPSRKTPVWLKALRPLIGNRNYDLLRLASGCDMVSDDLKRLSGHPRVFYLDRISEETRELLYAVSDLFIMPNRTIPGDMEGFGMVAIEAAVRGLPVVATGIEGITDAVVHGENGYCIAEGDSAAMISTIVALTENPDQLRTLGARARAFTLQRFSPESNHIRYARLFESLLNPHDRNTKTGSLN